MKTIEDLNRELVEKLSLAEYVDLFCAMLRTLSDRGAYYAYNREH